MKVATTSASNPHAPRTAGALSLFELVSARPNGRPRCFRRTVATSFRSNSWYAGLNASTRATPLRSRSPSHLVAAARPTGPVPPVTREGPPDGALRSGRRGPCRMRAREVREGFAVVVVIWTEPAWSSGRLTGGQMAVTSRTPGQSLGADAPSQVLIPATTKARVDDPGLSVCSGGRTRTPNDWTRTSSVTDYTTPEGGADTLSARRRAAHTIERKTKVTARTSRRGACGPRRPGRRGVRGG
jgi:hypothetical protein